MADIKLNKDFDFEVANGDFVLTETDLELDQQTAQLLISLDKGQILDYPFDGFGMNRLINDPLTELTKTKMLSYLDSEGINPSFITQDKDGNIIINFDKYGRVQTEN